MLVRTYLGMFVGNQFFPESDHYFFLKFCTAIAV